MIFYNLFLGIRKFISTHLRAFYLHYRTIEIQSRNFYEIILENTPCRLYFDLEYYKKFNPAINSIKILEDFLDVCIKVIAERLNYKLDREKNFLLLDSSTDVKFRLI